MNTHIQEFCMQSIKQKIPLEISGTVLCPMCREIECQRNESKITPQDANTAASAAASASIFAFASFSASSSFILSSFSRRMISSSWRITSSLDLLSTRSPATSRILTLASSVLRQNNNKANWYTHTAVNKKRNVQWQSATSLVPNLQICTSITV